MKKLIALLLCLSIILCGCGGASKEIAEIADPTSVSIIDVPVEPVSVTNPISSNHVSIEESVVFDNGDFKLTAKEIDFSDNYSVKVKILAENNTEKTVSIIGHYFSINGITLYCNFYIELSPGKKANDFIEIRKDDLAYAGIGDLATIQAQDCYIYDKDNSKKITDFKFYIETSIADGYQQEIDRTGQTVYAQNGIVIKYRGIVPGAFGGEELEFYVENTTDANIEVYVDNVSVNGFMVYGSMVAYAYPNCVTYATLDFSSSDLEENDIEFIEEVSLNLYGYDEDANKRIWITDEFTVGRNPVENTPIETTIVETVSAETSPFETSSPTINTNPTTSETTDVKTIDFLADSVTTILKANYEYCETSYDETGFTADIYTDGLAAICSLANNGNTKMQKNWTIVVDNVTALSKKIVEVFDSHGYDNYTVCVNIMNDQNPDNIILMTVNGTVVYNAAE